MLSYFTIQVTLLAKKCPDNSSMILLRAALADPAGTFADLAANQTLRFSLSRLSTAGVHRDPKQGGTLA
jgi:hypothetical protein